MQPLESSSSAIGSSALHASGAGRLEAAAAARSSAPAADPFSVAASPVPGRSELPSHTELLGGARGAGDVSAAWESHLLSGTGTGGAGAGVEADVASLRRGLEDARAVVRELQRQHRHDARWRSEIESTVEGFRLKLGSMVSREAVDDVRATMDRHQREIAQDLRRQVAALETTVETSRGTTATELAGLRSELSDLVAAVGKSSGDERPLHSHSVQGLTERHLDKRMSALEQQAAKLTLQLGNLTAQPSPRGRDSESVAAESAARRVEATERKAADLEALLERVQERSGKLSQEIRGLRDAAEGERERGVQFQQSLEELRERSAAGLSGMAANVAALDASCHADRLRLDDETRAIQRSLRDVEQRFSTGTEQLVAEAKSAVGATVAEAMGEAEARIEIGRQRLAEQVQQLSSRLRKAEDAAAGMEAAAGGGVAAVLERVQQLEVAATDETLNCERLERRLEGRISEVRLSMETEREQRTVDAQSSFSSRLQAQRADVERRIEQLTREVRTVALTTEAVQDAQRRQSQDLDVGRMEEKDRTEKLRLKVEELDENVKGLELEQKSWTAKWPQVESSLIHVEQNLKQFEQDLEHRIKGLEVSSSRLEPQLVDIDMRLRDFEREVGKLEKVELRLRELELTSAAFEPRIEKMREQQETHVRGIGEGDSRLRELESQIRELEPRLRDASRDASRELEPVLKDLKDLQVWQLQSDPCMRKLETRAESMQQSLHTLDSQVTELKSLDHRLFIEHKVGEARAQVKEECIILQKNLEGQINDCLASVRTDSSAWRDALRAESASRHSIREELQHSISEVQDLANRSLSEVRDSELKEARAREEKLADGINELHALLMRQTEETDAKLSQTFHEFSWRMGQRVDEADASAGEARQAVTELDRALDAIRHRVEKDKQEAAKELMRILDLHTQATTQQAATQAVAQASAQAVAQATETFKSRFDEASKNLEETNRQTTRALAELSDMERDLGKKFERWSVQAHESFQIRLQDMTRTSLADIVASAERQSEKVARQAHLEVHAEVKEEARRLKEEVCNFTQNASRDTERALAELQRRVESFIGETSATVRTLTSETARLDSQDVSQQAHLHQLEKQEAAGREAVENAVAAIRRGLEQERVRVGDLCERVLPGLRELHGAIVDEQQSRGEENSRVQERMREWESRTDAQNAQQRRTEAVSRGLADAIRECESAAAVADRRISGLEESLEERMHGWVTGEVTQNVIQHLENQQRGQMIDLQGKMDKLIRNLHTPSGYGASFGPVPPGGESVDRDMWRQRFRSSLGDSLYVKKSLQRGGRAPSADSFRCRGGGPRGP